MVKIRDSGMPDAERWNDFFDPASCLSILGVDSAVNHLVDFGAGYGTFAIVAAQIIKGTVTALEIEPELAQALEERAAGMSLSNLTVESVDFMANGSGIQPRSADVALIFNILHTSQPRDLLAEAQRVVRPDGLILAMHWRHDPLTPRGPALSIRPRPRQIVDWANEIGLIWRDQTVHDLKPWHYGLQFINP